MKKLLILTALLLLCSYSNINYTQVFAADKAAQVEVQAETHEQETKVLEASIEFDWVNMLQLQRDEKIEYYHNILFGSDNLSINKKDFRTQYKDFKKDNQAKTHYRLINGGLTETETDNMSGFFKEFHGENILLAYAIQPKNDIRHVYYYSAMGRLAYVDMISDNYPNFPYHSRQYRANGKLAGLIYFETKDLQYVYEPNGSFKGVWYKDKMFDRNGKEIMTRSNW